MENKDVTSWDKVVNNLKNAALLPQRRSEMIAHALQELLICLPAVGTALVWPFQDGNTPWKVYYAGTNEEAMQRWLTDRLDFSLSATLGTLHQDLDHLADMPTPHLICLQPASKLSALWIVWTPLSLLSRAANDCLKDVHRTLEALIEVESLEEHYFSSSSPLSDRATIEALEQGDPGALSLLLGLTRLVGHADLTFWGRAYPDVVETKDHHGAERHDFGFTLERGKGAGGRIAAHGTPILTIEDYRNSPYRHPSVSATVDSEKARSGIVLSVRSRIEQKVSEDVAGVLYVARRIIKPFSLAEQLLVQRLARQLEPLRPLTRPFSLRVPDLPPISDQRSAWYKVVLNANQRP